MINSDLISRSALMQYINDNHSYAGLPMAAHICTMELLTYAPAVEAVEVVHGQWVNPYMNRYGHPCHCCSVCGFKASYQDKNYCPNCGAQMNGGELKWME